MTNPVGGQVRLALACVLGLGVAAACQPTVPAERARLDPSALLGAAADSGFARAVEIRPFVFPEDHGAHPEYRTEWWYVTANLRSDEGREFGVQFTLFRSALAPPGPDRPKPASVWESNQAYMGHFALADVAASRYVSFERFGRGAAGIAGARTQPGFRVWLDDWSLGARDRTTEGADGIFPLTLRAADSLAAIDLVLERGRPMVLQGDRGLSKKGQEEGQASYYFTYPRMEVTGTVRSGRENHDVVGVAWMDREWSTSVLAEDQEGWDWFALRLPDGRDLMLFELRSAAGEPVVDGTLIEASGRTTNLDDADTQISVLSEWESPVDGARYPAGWRIRIPSYGVDLTVEPLLPDQEFRHTFRYWEGAVRVTDTQGGEARGYVELTGYAGVGIQR